MRELNKEELESLGIIWNKIKSGTAQNIRDKEEAGIARLWIIYYNTKDEIREIKSLYNPEEYKGARVVYTDKELLKKLKK